MVKQKVTLPFNTYCQNCNGTGAYSGGAEMEHQAVKCYTCNGTGYVTEIELDVFVNKRHLPLKITEVILERLKEVDVDGKVIRTVRSVSSDIFLEM